MDSYKFKLITNMGNTEIPQKQIYHQKFGNVSVPTSSSLNQMYIPVQIFSKSLDLDPWLCRKNHQAHIYQPSSLVYNVEVMNTTDVSLCNDSCTVLLKGEKYESTIQEQIQKRKQIKNYYTHEQIWFLFFQIIKLSVYVHRQGGKWFVGNIHPKNILINNEGIIKIITKNSLPYERDHYQGYCNEGISEAFISPELIGFYMKRKHTPLKGWEKKENYRDFPNYVDKQKSQIFTIGMTMLTLCNLQNDLSMIYDTSSYFDFPEKRLQNSVRIMKQKTRKSVHTYEDLLNPRQLHNWIENVKNRYCEVLGLIIEEMLKGNPDERISIEELYEQLLKKNEDEIYNMDLSWLGKYQSSNKTESESQKQNEEEILPKPVTPFHYQIPQ